MQKHSLDKEISDNKKIICYKINIKYVDSRNVGIN